MRSYETMMMFAAIACHEANKRYCATIGDYSHAGWDETPDDIKASCIDGVRNALKGATPQESHENWMKLKKEQGWIYGEKKDHVAKTHPCLVPYDELPSAQKKKDEIFISTVARVEQMYVGYAGEFERVAHDEVHVQHE